ncbi:hypothetical protein K7W42_21810 [Deinococcus sp. HMF7604]|uniref:hypothetical protein n=1 Tax=Deinococcus betulae TaxID=2873312 RepID=UPI001CCC7E12|nr:hypothetical protein [Deinococcus betulae]MBZ9753474.1 hypothetical protein [Deinococcus betulae]
MARVPLDIRQIYLDPRAAILPRGQAILAQFPGAERIEVSTHQWVTWRPPGTDQPR